MSYSQSQQGAYALILGEVNGNRRLPIIIGGFEAQAIAIELEKMKPTRPLTHDLFKNFATIFNIVINEVIINKFYEGVFFARLVCFDGKRTIEIDSRTSDAVALAIRFNCPIYTYEKILTEAGIVIEEEAQQGKTEKDEGEADNGFIEHTLEELEKLLKTSIENEEYEKASLIRDEINKRRNQ